MGFLGIEFAKAAPHYRKKRFAAFTIDIILVIVIWSVMYRITCKPDFISVKQAMDNARALPPAGQQEAMNLAFTQFDEAFKFGLIIWFYYEAVTTVISGGFTVGKALMKLQIVPINPKRNPIVHRGLLIVRSALKMLFLYLFQGFPFFISALNVFTTEDRSGFDAFVKTKVTERRCRRGS